MITIDNYFEQKIFVDFISFLKNTLKNGNVPNCSIPEQTECFNNVVNILKSNDNPEEIYYILGNCMSVKYTSFEKIGFREDCFDYLLTEGFNENDAYALMEGIRKGIFAKPKFDIYRSKLKKDFIVWAEKVEYLASRNLVVDLLKEEFEKFQTQNIYDDNKSFKKGYRRNDIIEKCEKAFKDIKTFYKQPFINYAGKTTDTNEYYTEIISEFLINNFNDYINGIPQITRETTYKTATHTGEVDSSTPREEEKIAIEMFNQSENGIIYDFIGKIIDYQTPLKNKRTDVAGKIDLLSYDGNCLRVLELKKPCSDESMLRCVLEGFTYLKTVDKPKLLDDFKLPKETKVVACPFVFKNGKQHQEILENRPYLFKLMELLESKPYYISKENDLYIVEE